MLNGRERFDVVSVPKSAPTLLVKSNWNEPLLNILAPVNVGGVGTGTLMLTMLLVLGMPLTKTVTSAQPGGKFQTGREVKKFVDQLMGSRNVVHPLSMPRS